MNSSNRTQRVAKNSIVLLARMFLLMVVNLYAVKVLLARLGVEDFGIFNAVAGVVTSLSFLASVLSLGTQRFYSFLAGKGETEKQKQVFSASLLISLCSSAIVFLLFQTIAIWFLNNRMNIPVERLDAANVIAYFSLCVFVCNLLQIPFSAAMISNEDMGLFAGISTMDVLLRFAAALLIGVVSLDRLMFYGGCLFVVAVLVLSTYILMAVHRYSECRIVKLTDRGIFRQLLSFSGWVLYGTLANVGLIQGSVILINLFFGPIVNASFAIAIQIYNAFMSLANSVIVAVRPAMNKLYAEDRIDALLRTFYMSNKFLYAAMVCIAIPIFIEMEMILSLWLNVTDATSILFCRMIIVYIIVIAMNNPITIMMHSAGDLRLYHLCVETVALLCVPITLLLFYLGAPSYMVFVSMITLAAIAHIIRLICLKRTFPTFSMLRYSMNFCLRSLAIATVTATVLLAICNIFEDSLLRLFVNVVTSVALISVIMYHIGLDKPERQIVADLIKRHIRRIIK